MDHSQNNSIVNSHPFDRAKRFVENKEIIVKTSDYDLELASTKDYVEIRNNKSYWKNRNHLC